MLLNSRKWIQAFKVEIERKVREIEHQTSQNLPKIQRGVQNYPATGWHEETSSQPYLIGGTCSVTWHSKTSENGKIARIASNLNKSWKSGATASQTRECRVQIGKPAPKVQVWLGKTVRELPTVYPNNSKNWNHQPTDQNSKHDESEGLIPTKADKFDEWPNSHT